MKRNYDPEKVAYIYQLVDPRDNSIKYVGWTFETKARLRGHVYESKDKYSDNYHTKKNEWMRELAGCDLKPILNIIEVTDFKHHGEREKCWIKFYGRKNLTNATDGGDGYGNIIPVDPFRMSGEQIRKRLTNIWFKKYDRSVETDLRMRYDVDWDKLSKEEQDGWIKSYPKWKNPFLKMEEDELREIIVTYLFEDRLEWEGMIE